MEFSETNDRSLIYKYLSKDIPLHIYEIGDLDDFFFPHTRWFAGTTEGQTEALVLLYNGLELPTLLALSDNPGPVIELIRLIRNKLPANFYAHLSPGIDSRLDDLFAFDSHGEHYKMHLKKPEKVASLNTDRAIKLDQENLNEVENLFKRAYPGNWFEKQMLETGQYYGVFDKSRLIAVGGVHVYSPQYKAAAMGNIAVDPEYRKQGIGKIITAACCQSLLKDVSDIGLNVSIENIAAVKLYKALGFVPVGRYYEYMVNK